MTTSPIPPTLPPAARIAVGFVVLATGIALAVIGAFKVNSDPRAVIGVLAGLIFVFGGALVLLPPALGRLQLPLAALMVTSLAAVFDWVAFGPGDRAFSGSFGMGSATAMSPIGEMAGRLFFGFFALLMDVAALGLWIKIFARPRSKE